MDNSRYNPLVLSIEKFDYSIQKYEVNYRLQNSERYKTCSFVQEERAVEFGNRMIKQGFVVQIKRIEIMEGWC